MANPGKFVSVNLNKSYGKPNSSSSNPSFAASTSSAFGHGSRTRPGSGGGGMVVLSRPRSSGSASQKTGSRLSVPPPLNLPSLRKEHERFDTSSMGASAGAGNAGHGSGQGTHAMGWTKPGLASKDQVGRLGAGDQRVGSPVYVLSGSQSAGQPSFAAVGSGRALNISEKAVVLRGEDFPSLMATTTSSQKHKDVSKQKQKPRQAGDEPPDVQADKPSLESHFDMRPHMGSSRLVDVKRLEGNGGLSHLLGSGEHLQKLSGALPSPLSLVQLAHTSDWADDERDTGHAIQDRDNERRFSRTDSFQVFDHSGGRRPRDSEAETVPSREGFRGDSFGRDLNSSSTGYQDASSWRAQPHSRSGFPAREVVVDRGGVDDRAFCVKRETGRESYKNGQLLHADRIRSSFANGAHETHYTRTGIVYGQNMSNGNYAAETPSGRSADPNMRGRYSDLTKNRYKVDAQQNNTASKALFSSGNKGYSVDDPLLNFGREKHIFSSNRKLYLEDAGLDSRDPFSLIGDSNLKLFKRKKDVQKQVDFHDPVRESFEAELERVQRMQELERQRVLEEQNRALELARRQEEERERLAREEEEQKRRLEEEAREAAWRTEQERLEVVRRAEEQKLAREEEKRRILMEEERRKLAAREKLLELEARIARRQAESATKDDSFHAAPSGELVSEEVKVSDAARVADIRDWEDGERMVDRITNSASSYSSSINRPESAPWPHSTRDGNPSFMERGKFNAWKRDAFFDSGSNSTILSRDVESGCRSSRRDVVGTGRMFLSKEFYGGPGSGSTALSSNAETTEPPQMLLDLRNSRGNRWNGAGYNDYFTRTYDNDAEFPENDRFDDGGWGHSQSRSSSRDLYAESSFHTSDVDGFASFGRSRHTLRQPRVLPPPAMSSVHKSSIRPEPVHHSNSVFLEGQTRYKAVPEKDVETVETGYDSLFQDELQQGGILASPEEGRISPEQKEDKDAPPCDSQSSLSVSSPPSSPTHLSHDDLDDSGDSPSLPVSAEGEGHALPNQKQVVSAIEVGKTNFVVSHRDEDEWAIENDQDIQEQEVYDEEDGYQDEDEVHEGNIVTLDLSQEFEDLHNIMQDVTGEMGQLVLGFDEGVEVRIPSTSEFEGTSENGEKEISTVTVSNGAVQELGPLDGISSDARQISEVKNTSAEEMEGSSSNIAKEMEKALRDLALQPVASTGDTMDSIDTTNSSGMQTQQTVTYAFDVPLVSTPSTQPILPSVSPNPSQAEVPVKLQFGLFSGPTLIPSPVPAIQIGSIQMPLHLHPPLGPSLTQVHHSPSPYFQFGQLTYTTPVSQGILPLAPQSMPYVQSAAPTRYSLNQQGGGSLHCQANQDSLTQVSSSPMNDQSALAAKPLSLFRQSESKEPNALLDMPRSEVLSSQNLEASFKSNYRVEQQGTTNVTLKTIGRLVINSRESRGPPPAEPVSSQFSSRDKAASGMKSSRTLPGGRGKRYVYTVRNAGSRSFIGSESSHADSGVIQRRARRNIRRTEFRVRENDRRQTEGMDSPNYTGLNEKPNFNGRLPIMPATNGAKRDPVLFKSSKLMIEPGRLTSGSFSSQVAISDGKLGRRPAKAASTKRLLSSTHNSHSVEVEEGLKRNGNTEDDVDAPLQCGVVRVFKQPGIEAPSDEDDFIEVRSKRQMLNDRREQREKEIKARSRVIKAPRKSHSVSQGNNGLASNSNRPVASLVGMASTNVHSDHVATVGASFADGQPSSVFNPNLASQPLPPIGTPAVNADTDKLSSIKSFPSSSISLTTDLPKKLVAGLSFEDKNVVDNVPTSLGSWDHVDMNQQVMTLTQTQLDEAMTPVRFEAHTSSIGDPPGIGLELGKQSVPVMIHDRSFSSSANPLNSLLAGEKIQFGAVTAPSILSVSRAVTGGIGLPGSGKCRSDISSGNNLSGRESNCPMYFEKEKMSNESGVNFEDPEAEAEAAASAVAVAAISSDEIVGSGLDARVLAVSEAKNFVGADVMVLTSGGVTGTREVSSQSVAEESLSVALPADLSVETPSLSLWPPVPSPQSSSNPMLSRFPGASPSHFPCFEMNPMLGGPIFSYGLHDESNTQSQPQRSTTLGSAPLGAWPQCHSGVDSFYGPPSGFTGPFISPGGIPGVQGSPQMVFYNHFTPFGQFGQQVLSYMGTTYIPSGKQPDWKHNPASTAVGVSEVDITNLNVVPGQHNPPSMPAPIQHLAPGSPLMPIPSPMAMFDISPFQSSGDIPVQARWSHVPAPLLHSVPISVSLQQHQVDVGLTPQLTHCLPVSSSCGNTRFHEPRSSMPLDSSSFAVPTDTAARFPEALGLVDTPGASTACVHSSRSSYICSSGNNNKGSNGADYSSRSAGNSSGGSSGIQNGGSINNSTQSMASASKPQSSQPSTPAAQQYFPSVGYPEQRSSGTSSQKLGAGGEWHRRNIGFQGKNQMLGADKSYSASKVKQIYVAKPPTTSGAATPG